jgi:hypothetical protein
MTVGDEQFEVGVGELVVVPPDTIHGINFIDLDAQCDVVGELQMGEWITVIDSDGSRREVEAHLPGVPWHRPLTDGEEPVSMDEFVAMMESTLHLI